MNRNTITLLMSVLCISVSAKAQGQSEVWMTVADDDSIHAIIGQTLTVDVHLNTAGEQISGLQLFFSFPEEQMIPVPWETNGSDTTWFEDTGPQVYSRLFAGPHRDRDLAVHMEGNRLDWGVQTTTSQNGERPTFSYAGVICRFKVLVQGEMDFHELGFDHHNFYFRNTIYWLGQENQELNFRREDPVWINVLGLEFGPLPDVYLTNAQPVDSLNLYDFMGQTGGLDNALLDFHIPSLVNNVCNIDTIRTEDAFWMIMSDNGGTAEQVQIQLIAGYDATTVSTNIRILKGEPPAIDEELIATDPLLISFPEDETFVLDLDNYVEDPNTPVADLNWTVLNVTEGVLLEIDPDTHLGTFSADPDWYGVGSILLQVEDPIGMTDVENVPIHVIAVNDAPTLDFGDARLDVNLESPTVLDLADYCSDIDNLFESLVFSSVSDTSQIALRINNVTQEIELEVRSAQLFDTMDFLITVTDDSSGVTSDSLHVLVNSYPPEWLPVGEVVFLSTQSAFRNLNDYLSDQDNEDDELILAAQGQNNIVVQIDTSSHVAEFSCSPLWRGVESIELIATDPDQNQGRDTVLAISLFGLAPTVGNFGTLLMRPGEHWPTLPLDSHVWDIDTPDESITWTIEHNNVFTLSHFAEMRTYSVTAPTTVGSFDWIHWQATDPQGNNGEVWSPAVVIDTTGVPSVIPFREIRMSTFAVDSSVTLMDHVYDLNHSAAEIDWLLVSNPRVTATILLPGKQLVIESSNNTGRDTLWVRAIDPDSNIGEGFIPLIISEGQAPVVSEFPPHFVIAGQTDTLETISSYVYDEDIGDAISWSFTSQDNSPITMSYLVNQDAALIQTDATHVGVDLVLAIARDLSQNADSAWVEVHSLENRPPGMNFGVFVNSANPALLDLVGISDELLSGPPAGSIEGELLPFVSLPVQNADSWIYRADFSPPPGLTTVHITSQDVVGNVSQDSLIFSSGTLGGPGDEFPSADGELYLYWSRGQAQWTTHIVVTGENDTYGNWKIFSTRSDARAELQISCAKKFSLERRGISGWQMIPTVYKNGILRAHSIPAGEFRLIEAALPLSFVLYPAAPNPFNPSTRLSFELPHRSFIDLTIYDLLGRRVQVLLHQELGAGQHAVQWRGDNQHSVPVASGVYIARMTVSGQSFEQKLLLVK